MPVQIVSFGGGVNSTALLIGMEQKGQRPDAVIFADTGNERDYTYRHLEIMQVWCKDHGFPEITIVRNKEHKTLYDECIDNETLPSKAFGFAGCSVKWKRQPMDRFLKDFSICLEAWDRGEQVQRLIGIHAGESHRGLIPNEKKYTYHRPLVEWGWGQQECEKAISDAGMKVPRKSACYFCPAAKKHEVIALSKEKPELFQLCVEMEKNAAPNLVTVKGLGRAYSWEALVKRDASRGCLFVDDGLEICDTCIDW